MLSNKLLKSFKTLRVVTLELILLSSTASWIASCAVEEERGEQEIVLSAQTRSENSSSQYIDLDAGEKIGAYIIESGMENINGSFKPTNNLFDNLLLIYQSKVLKPESTIYYPVGVSHVDYYAYAPYSKETTISSAHSTTFFIQLNQSAAEALKKSDLLWAKLLNVETNLSTPPSLIFEHSLSKLVIKFKQGVGVTLINPTVEISGTKTGIDLKITDGTLSNLQGGPQPITPLAKESKTEFEAITIPQMVARGTKLFSVSNNGKQYDYIMKADKEFESGKKYIYEITVNADDLEVEVNGAIKDWSEGGTIIEDIN